MIRLPVRPLNVDISLDCTNYQRVEEGLPFHDREGITLSLPANFPFSPPSVDTAHTRFHGFGHVQWGHRLCIYLSTETQWIPSQGMSGFLAQLDEWFRRGARNELDHPEGPLHPPVAYPVASTSICVNADTPGHDTWPWFGAAVLTQPKPDLLHVNAWLPIHTVPNDLLFAPTVLLNFELPFEYPRTVHHLLDYLESKAELGYRLLAHLMLASERIPGDSPLYVGIGAPSRGVAGDLTQRNQHLTFWEIEAADVAKLRAASIACQFSNHYKEQDTPAVIQELIDSILETLFTWRNQARVRWCRVFENRPEIVTRRDEGTPMDWFRGKRVALWGCGAIGGLIAEHLARAGISQLTLYDWGRVTPGVLVRQNFSASDTNDAKAAALARRIRSIAPDLQCDDQGREHRFPDPGRNGLGHRCRPRHRRDRVPEGQEQTRGVTQGTRTARANRVGDGQRRRPPRCRRTCSARVPRRTPGRASASRHRGRNPRLVDRLGEGFFGPPTPSKASANPNPDVPIQPSSHRTPTWPAFRPKHSMR